MFYLSVFYVDNYSYYQGKKKEELNQMCLIFLDVKTVFHLLILVHVVQYERVDIWIITKMRE